MTLKLRSNPVVVLIRGVWYESLIGSTDREIADPLSRNGFEVYLLLRARRNISFRGSAPARLVTVGIAVGRVPVANRLAFLLACLRWLVRTKPNIVMVWPGTVVEGLLYRILARTKLIVDIRSIPVEFGVRAALQAVFTRMILKLPWTDAMTFITRGMLALILGQGGTAYTKPTFVWSSGVNPKVFNPKIHAISRFLLRRTLKLDDRFVLLYHGSITMSRGLGNVVEAISIVHKLASDSKVTLLIVGSGSGVAQLKEMIAKLNLGKFVMMLPEMPYEMIPKIIAASDVGIIPHPNEVWCRYSSPLKLFECISMGKPMIATDIVAHRGVSDAVLLVADNSPSAFANAILSLLDMSSEQLSRLQTIAIKNAKSFSWENRAKGLSEFLKLMLDVSEVGAP